MPNPHTPPPVAPVVIEAREVPERAILWVYPNAAIRPPMAAQYVADLLSSPTVQALMVAKLGDRVIRERVEAARDPLDGTIRVLTKMHHADPGKVVVELLPEELLAALTGAAHE